MTEVIIKQFERIFSAWDSDFKVVVDHIGDGAYDVDVIYRHTKKHRYGFSVMVDKDHKMPVFEVGDDSLEKITQANIFTVMWFHEINK